jgi:hypothetical protein
MKITGAKKRFAFIALLLPALSACFAAAHAEQLYEPPATAGAAVVIPSLRDEAREERDCKREVDTELRAEQLQSGGRVIHLRPAR